MRFPAVRPPGRLPTRQVVQATCSGLPRRRGRSGVQRQQWTTGFGTAGETFIVWDDNDAPAATITINRFAKPELWTEEEAAQPALYAHKVTVDRTYAGQGLGAELLDWAGTRAADEGADWLRVDVWTTNGRLQHYYLRQGFTYVRTVVLPHNPSGALFQRPALRVSMPRLQEASTRV